VTVALAKLRWLAWNRIMNHRPRLCLLLLSVVILVTTGCSPARLAEASRVLADIDAGAGPSSLKEQTPPPVRRTIRYSVAGRKRTGDLYVPGNGALAAMVLVPGVTREGKDDARLVAFANTLVRARFEVLVPDLPNLRDLKVSPADARALADASVYLDGRGSSRRRTGMTAISYAVGPAVAALFEAGMEGRIDFLVAIGGYYDIDAVITFFTTGYYRIGPQDTWRYRRPNAYGKWVFVRSNADRLRDPDDRALLRIIADRKLTDPGADIAELSARLGPEGRSVFALLANREPDRVPAFVAALPAGVVEDTVVLDLKRRDLASLKVRFLLVHGRDDPIIPETESQRLGEALQHSALFLVDSLDHVDPKPAGFVDKFKLLQAIYALLELRDGGPEKG
jgi:pimeloyl-ACP methyl ester carboxylesterase